MNRTWVTVMGVFVVWAAISSGVFGFSLFDSAYHVETYGTYLSTTMNTGMAIDSSGNIYLAHSNENKIMKIDTTGAASVFATGLVQVNNIAWGGGTSYGDNLYGSCWSTGKVYQITPSGAWSTFSTIAANHTCDIAIDQYGYYGGKIYASTTDRDHFYSVNTNGTSQIFDHWLVDVGNEMPTGIAFDPSGKYGHSIYVGTSYSQNNAFQSGLFTLDTAGHATKFSNQIERCHKVVFDPYGTMFNNDLFAVGVKYNDSSDSFLYRVDPSGNATPFIQGGLSTYAFGPDGAMYFAEYAWPTGVGVVTISRISLIPEPMTVMLLLSGAVMMRRRKPI